MNLSWLLLARRLAFRELRSGIQGFGVFLACLALGVAVIAAVGTLSASVEEGVAGDAKAILGGDVELSQSHRPVEPEVLAWLRERGRVAEVLRMRAMVKPGGGGRSTLIDLKAVGPDYPLYGAVELEGGANLAEALAERDGLPGVAVEKKLLERLGLSVGGVVNIGDSRFRIGGVLLREPDRAVSLFTLGPRLVIRLEDMDRTGLLLPGSVVFYFYRVALPPGADIATFKEDLAGAFPEQSWRVRDFEGVSPSVGRFVDRMAMYLTLVGLTAMLVGGIGVANAVGSYLAGRLQTVAMLKCLGAERRLIIAVYLIQTMLLAAVGIGAGLAVGLAVPPLLAALFQDYLPVAPAPGIYLRPLAIAATYGFLTALVFSLWPLSAAGAVSPANLFRGYVEVEPRRPTWRARGAVAAAGMLLALVTVLTSSRRSIGLGFVAGAAASFFVYRGFAWLVQRAAARAPRPSDPRLRLGLSNIHRPSAPTVSVVFSLGLGLTVLIAVALIDGNMQLEISQQIPSQAPSFFFVDIQSDQIDAFREVAAAVPGVERIESQPSLRGRITRINSVPAEEAVVDPDVSWALRSDRGLTYAAAPPPGTRIVKGEWWPADYVGPPLISFDAQVAKGFGIGVGDTLTVNVLGREITATVASLRDIDWATLGINHTIIFAPGVLEGAPHAWIATAYAVQAAENALFDTVTTAFPNVSVINIRDVLDSVTKIFRDIGTAVRSTAGVTLLAGLLVLAEALRANLRSRYHDAVVLKVVGATRRDILLSLASEYSLLSLATALLALGLGAVISFVFIERVMSMSWTFLPGTAVLTALGGVATTLVLGLGGVWRILGREAWPVLRNE